MKRLLLAFTALFLLNAASPALAATAKAPAAKAQAAGQPDPASNPVLASIQKMGAKFYYLGFQANMHGWFVVKDKQVQIVYGTPDNQSAIVGALFAGDGQNVTAAQVAALIQTNPEVAELLAAAQKEQAAIAQVGSPAAPVGNQALGPVAGTPASPGERLIRDLSSAATVVVGSTASPEILMVTDPNCPHCKATWNILREPISKGSVHVRLIPIGTEDTDGERAAAILLGVSDPYTAWDKHVGGDKAALAGAASAISIAAVRANHAVIDNWKIKTTPYLVYRAKDGKVKIVQGEITNSAAILTDLGQ